MHYTSIPHSLMTKKNLPIHICGLIIIGNPNAHLVIVQGITFQARGHKLNMVVNIGGKYGGCYVYMDVNMQHMMRSLNNGGKTCYQ